MDYALDPENKKLYTTCADEWRKKAEKYKYQKFNEEYLAKDKTELLPAYERAVIDDNKLTGYALNKKHPSGKHKAVAFEKYLGYTIDNKEELVEQVRQNLSRYKCSTREATQYGQPFEVPMIVKGANGRYARVKTGWIIDKGSTAPRLTSIYVDE